MNKLESAENKPIPRSFGDYNVDEFLQDILENAYRGSKIPMTLFVKGQIISGVVVGGKEWFERHTESMIAQGANPEAAQSWTVPYIKAYDKPRDEASEPLRFLH